MAAGQSITLHGLALGELQNYLIRKLYMKEVTLGALNGLGVGLIAAGADPAMASRIFLTTFTDIVGMA